MNKNLVFYLLMVCQLICGLALAIISPFFPPYAREKGISEDVVGIIFSANPVGAIIASIILGKILNQSNRFKFMISALILQACGLFMFAITKFQSTPTQIVATAIAARVVNGFATSCFLTPLYAYIPLLFPESIEQKVSIAEVFSALGFMLGPVVGSLLYSLGGYLTPFLVFGTLSLVFVPLIGYYFSRLQQAQQVADAAEAADATTPLVPSTTVDLDTVPLNYMQVFAIYPVLMTTVTGTAVNFMWNYFSPIVADFLENEHGASPATVGYYVCVMPGFYVVASIGVSYLTKNKTIYILAGMFLMGFASFFCGPSKQLTQLDPNIYVTLAAFALLGIAGSPVIIFTVPVINDYLTAYYPQQPTQCANIASALFNISIYTGELIGPIMAGTLVKFYSFDIACTYMGYILLLTGVLYIPVLRYKIKESDTLKRSVGGFKMSVLV